mgnify:CR=1 FL=1
MENNNVENEFGVQNSLVIMVPKGDYARERELLDYVLGYHLNGKAVFSSGLGLVSTGVLDEYTPNEIANAYGISEPLVLDAFKAMGKNVGEKVALLTLLEYLSNEHFAERTADDRQTQIDQQSESAKFIFSELSAAGFSETSNIDADAAKSIYMLMGVDPADRIPFHETVTFISENQIFAAKGNQEGQVMIDDINQDIQLIQIQIDDAYQAAQNAVNMFESEELSRLIFNLNLPIASEEAFLVVENLREEVQKFYSGAYMLSESGTYLDIRNLFQEDTLIINLISFFAIFLIITLTFKSISIPVILTTLIQGAIWVTMAVNAVTGTPVFFICYLVIMCIQMGATVDYAILMTSKYTEARRTMNTRESVEVAFKGALPTILTSGTILVAAAFIVGIISNVTIISSLGMILARGCLCSLLFITFALPQILMLCDKVIMKTTLGINQKKIDFSA